MGNHLVASQNVEHTPLSYDSAISVSRYSPVRKENKMPTQRSGSLVCTAINWKLTNVPETDERKRKLWHICPHNGIAQGKDKKEKVNSCTYNSTYQKLTKNMLSEDSWPEKSVYL